VPEFRVPPPPGDHGEFEGRCADLFDHAFAVCYDMTYRGVTADPPGSGPRVVSAKRAVPQAAIGSADRDRYDEMHAVRSGCFAGQAAALDDSGLAPPAGWDSYAFPERDDELVPTGRRELVGESNPFTGVLARSRDLLIEFGNVVVFTDAVAFQITITPVGRDRLRREHRDPPGWFAERGMLDMPDLPPRRSPLSLSVVLPDGTSLVAPPGLSGTRHELGLDNYSGGASVCILSYRLVGQLPPEGSVKFSCDWPQADITGSLEVPVAGLRAIP
jgi:hypothetical protein